MKALRGALIAALALLALSTTPAASAADCAPAEGLQFICGPVASEDLVQVPGTALLISSGLNIGQPAALHLIDATAHSAAVLQPQWQPAHGAVPTAECTQPPDPARWSTDGLALLPSSRGPHRLYAANHGDRAAIELFDVQLSGAGVLLQWTGCVRLPAGTLPNAVTALPDGGLLAISFHNPDDPQAWQRMARGENTGRIFEWHPGGAVRELPGSAMSGGNGIALSADGRELYASAWSGRRIVVLSRIDGTRRELPLDFLPDNLKVLPDGSLLVAGQRSTVERIAACAGPRCPQPWVVARIDPRSGAVQPMLSGPGSERVDYAAGALIVNHELYVTVRGDSRLVYVRLP